MGRKKSKKGASLSSGRKDASPRDKRRREAADGGTAPDGGGPIGTSRLLLTRILRDGAIWQVYVATSAGGGPSNITRLEFESAGPTRGKVRYSRPVEGTLLDALHSGAPVSRAALGEELELAVRHAGAAATEAAPDTAPDTATENTPAEAAAPAADHSLSER